MIMADTSVEVEIEELKAQKSALEQLRDFKVDVGQVYRAWDHEVSDRTAMVDGQRRAAACVIFVDSQDRPRTALIVDDTIMVEVGWGGSSDV